MRSADIQRHIDNGTFFNLLMSEVVITPQKSERGKLMLEIVFPKWYTQHISKESQALIETLIRDNAQQAYQKSHSTNDTTDDDDETR